MNISTIRPGDIVYCDVRGDRFYALIEETDMYRPGMKNTGLSISSLTRRPLPTSFVNSRQVLAHYRKSPKSKV